jgi:cellulose synthase/poly-beta-1,6-N-acetylglucosamine synthase-like glycosyltransferase
MSIFFFIVAGLFTVKALLFIVAAALERAKARNRPSNQSLLRVSVIVPARNEEDNLALCLDSILQSTYHNYEIIIVNDRSSDKTGEIANTFAAKYPQIKVIHAIEEREGNLKGKPGALHLGIQNSQSDLIMMTDADCTVASTWIESIAKQFNNPRVGLVASYTVVKGTTFFEHMQDMEWLMNHTLACIGVSLDQPLGCFGNNLSIRRVVYKQIGGYPGIPFSVTEDLTLLQTVHKSGWKIMYPCDQDCAVETKPCINWSDFIKQLHRWIKGSKGLGWRKHIFVSFASIFWVFLATSIYNNAWNELFIVLFIRIFGDYILVLPSLSALKRMHKIAYVLPGMIFMMIIEAIIPFLFLKNTVVWKGQKFT